MAEEVLSYLLDNAMSDQVDRAIFNAALEGMLILDEQLRYVDVNPAACQVFGVPRERIIGAPLGSFSSDPASTREKFALVLGENAVGEFEIRTPEGTLKNLEYTTRRDFLPGRHLIVTRDMTERRALEQQLMQVQKMQAIGQLAGGVAHDFNNMLTVIRSYGELLQRQLPPESPQRRYADSILSATDRATMTTQQLLAFSRRQVVQRRELSVNTTVEEMGSLLQKLIGEDIQLRIELDPNLGRTRMDPGQLGQVLLNLAVNARDAMPNGGRLTIETANVSLDATYSRTHLKVEPGDYVMLSVTDNGCGISQETIARIFEPFFTTKAAGKGTGLGLSTVYGIVEQVGGAIYVYSEPGEGTTFKIYFPRVSSKPEPANDRKEGEHHGAGSVLIIDDDLQTAQAIATSLERSGYRVMKASSGDDAIRLLEDKKVRLSLIISDVTMPGTDGIDVQGYLAIRSPDARVIYISGYTRRTLRDRGVLPQDADFLQKPFRIEELVSLIKEVGASAHTS